jgi:phosphoenolpyruvate carboxylase
VMVGYSDSGKDAGRLAAAWGLYEAQEKLVSVASEFAVQLVFFHGRGGTVGRGGGPVQLAIRSQPKGTIQHGRMRVTVQGEVIEQAFGERDTAMRTLDQYISAMLEAELREPAAIEPVWRNLMSELSECSCKAYRGVVFEDPRFIAYFRDVTPNAELGRANIGSRPAKRKAVDTVAALRAIPWIFAWTQTRMNLPVWLGIGEAINSIRHDESKAATMRNMYQKFPPFRVLIDLVSMVFSQSDPNIAKLYDGSLATADELKTMGEELRQNYFDTRLAVRSLTGEGCPSLLGGSSEQESPAKLAQKSDTSAELQHTVDLRKTLIMPLNLMQVRCLREVRAGMAGGPGVFGNQERREAFEDTLLITVKGISAGLQNTG